MKRTFGSRLVGRLKERGDAKAPTLPPVHPRLEDSHKRPPPIFVIGVQRSGTTLLRRILDSHSAIACPAESKFILPLSRVLKDEKSLSGWASLGYGRDEVVESLGTFIRSFFDGYADAQRKPRWAEKTPNYVDCLPELWDMFGPDAQFITVLRHGLDVAFSLADPHRHYPAIDEYLPDSGGSIPVAAGLFWADKSKKVEEFRSAHPGSCHQIRYEELTANPEAALKPMFDFLGEPWEPEVMDYARFQHHGGYGDPDAKRRRRIETNSGKYKAWPADLQAAVAEACEPTLSLLGYG